MKFLQLYLSCIILALSCALIGKTLFSPKQKVNLRRLLVVMFIFSIISMIINIYATDVFKIIIKIIVTYILLCFYFVFAYKRNTSESIIIGFITYLSIFISETIVAIMLSIILKMIDYTSMEIFQNTIIINIIICGLSYLIILLSKNSILNLIKYSSSNKIGNIIIAILMIFTIALLGIRIPITEWKFNMDFIVTMLILLSFCIIGFLILKQKAVIKKTTSMYQQLVNYSEVTNKLLEDYRIVSHEHKNQLSIIRGMVDGSNQELIAYIDNLLNKRNIIKYQWATQLTNLPITGLKGLLNYKLIEMESQKININISISKDIAQSKLNKLTSKQKDELYSIMGIYLDNAIEAAKISKKKQVSLEIYKEKRDIIIILANTYSGKINLDKIDDYGYTTKGKNHGIGLHIVKRILDENKIFAQNRTLFEDYYVQELRVKLSNLNKQSK